MGAAKRETFRTLNDPPASLRFGTYFSLFNPSNIQAETIVKIRN